MDWEGELEDGLLFVHPPAEADDEDVAFAATVRVLGGEEEDWDAELEDDTWDCEREFVEGPGEGGFDAL